jgi:hypothetical protein
MVHKECVADQNADGGRLSPWFDFFSKLSSQNVEGE